MVRLNRQSGQWYPAQLLFVDPKRVGKECKFAWISEADTGLEPSSTFYCSAEEYSRYPSVKLSEVGCPYLLAFFPALNCLYRLERFVFPCAQSQVSPQALKISRS